MSEPIIYTCTPRQIRRHIMECMEANLVPYVTSSPGMGKSSIMADIARQGKLKMIDHRLSTSPPEDLSGLPRFTPEGFAEFAPFAELFPVEGMQVPKGMNGWMVFLDELPAAKKETQAASFKLILDKMTGQKKLHEQVWLTAAGNLMSDRSSVNPLFTAMQSRLIHLQMELSFDEWMMDVALKRNYHPSILAYLSAYRSKLMDFRPDHNDKTFCCPRTWDFMNDLLKVNPTISDDRAALFAGTITSGVAVDFINFVKVFNNLTPIKQILEQPETAPIPGDLNARWAVISSMLEHVNDKNFPALVTYANQFPLDFRILFFRSVMIRNPEMRQHPMYALAAVELSKYLHDE